MTTKFRKNKNSLLLNWLKFLRMKDNIIFATMRVKKIIDVIEEWAPPAHAEDFDNVGLIIGNPQLECKGILVTHDTLENVVDECIKKDFNFIVSFHPIIFSGLKKLTQSTYVEKVVSKAIKNDICVYAIHTALDNHRFGISHALAENLGLNNIEVLSPKEKSIRKLTTYAPKNEAPILLEKLYEAGAGKIGNYKECSFITTGKGTFKGNKDSNPNLGIKGEKTEVDEVQINLIFDFSSQQKILNTLFEVHSYEEVAYEVFSLENKNQTIGMGSVGQLENEMDEEEFINWVQNKLNIDMVRHSKKTGKKIKKVAVLGGSGSFAITKAKSANADAFITADLKYHDFFQAENKILLIDAGHYETEQFTKKLIHDNLIKKLPNFAIALSESITNPVNYSLKWQKKPK